MATVHDTKGVPMKNKMGDKVRLNDFAQQESPPSLSVSFCSLFLFVLYLLLFDLGRLLACIHAL